MTRERCSASCARRTPRPASPRSSRWSGRPAGSRGRRSWGRGRCTARCSARWRRRGTRCPRSTCWRQAATATGPPCPAPSRIGAAPGGWPTWCGRTATGTTARARLGPGRGDRRADAPPPALDPGTTAPGQGDAQHPAAAFPRAPAGVSRLRRAEFAGQPGRDGGPRAGPDAGGRPAALRGAAAADPAPGAVSARWRRQRSRSGRRSSRPSWRPRRW